MMKEIKLTEEQEKIISQVIEDMRASNTVVEEYKILYENSQNENADLKKKNKQLKILLKETIDKITNWEEEDSEADVHVD